MVPLERLERFAAQVFESCGVPTNEAATAAKVLLMADLRGIDSHGIARLCAYHGMLREGLINPTPRVKIVRETASTATVDGDNGLGLVVGPQANAIAIQKAEQAGSGWVSVKNTNHYGIAGAYSLQALEHGMIGISMTNSSAVVAPLYGKERFLGTNPIAIAFPGEHEKPIVIDMATSVVPWGKVEEYARMDSPLLPGWAIDSTGHTALNPEAVLKDGALMNLGGAREHSGHKGFCLAAMVDILCAVLSGGNWGPTVDGFTTNQANCGGEPSPEEPVNGATGIGHFFGALRIDGFREPKEFRQTIDSWIRTFRGCKPVDPTQPVVVPGEPEWEASETRSQHGVPVKLSVLADLVDVARDCGIEPPFDVESVNLDAVKRVVVDRA